MITSKDPYTAGKNKNKLILLQKVFLNAVHFSLLFTFYTYPQAHFG